MNSIEGDSVVSSSPAGRRSTPRPADRLPSQSAHTPSIVAVTERQRADLWKVVSLAVCLLSFLLAWLSIRAGRATERVLVLDPAGNVYAGPLETLSESRDFFQTTTLFAVNAALQRSPAGFDLYDLLKLYFTPRAVQKLEEDLQRRREDVRTRNLQQKPLIETVGAPVKAGSNRLVEVRGRVVCVGAYAGQSFYDEPPFSMVLVFRKNPNLGKAGAYPWICDDFELRLNDSPK